MFEKEYGPSLFITLSTQTCKNSYDYYLSPLSFIHLFIKLFEGMTYLQMCYHHYLFSLLQHNEDCILVGLVTFFKYAY